MNGHDGLVWGRFSMNHQPGGVLARLLPAVVLVFLTLPAPAAESVAQAGASDLASAKARQLFMMHRRAIKALETTVRGPSFKRYFAATDDAQRTAGLAAIEKSTLKVQRYFDIEEMCLIDRSGRELLRLVRGEPEAQLSTDEAANVFFEPAFALSEGDVLVSPVYRSPDTGQRVLAYVTPIAMHGINVALLHYEHDLAGMTRELTEEIDASSQALIAMDEAGRFLFDSRDPETLKLSAESDLPQDLGGLTSAQVLARIDAGEPLDGYAGAYKKVRGWTVIALQR